MFSAGISAVTFGIADNLFRGGKHVTDKVSEQAIAGDLCLRSDPTTYFDYIGRRTDIDPDGFYDIVVHGAPDRVQITIHGEAQAVDHRFIGRMLEHSPDYHGQKLRLLSCNTGSLDNGFAQNLANYMNVEVVAPTKYLWAFANGYHDVAGGKYVGRVLQRVSEDVGEMRKFFPGGNIFK